MVTENHLGLVHAASSAGAAALRLACSCGLPSWRRCPDRRSPTPPGPLATPPRTCAERSALIRATDDKPAPWTARNAGHWTRSPDPRLHRPARPSWRCRVDGAPWPCQPAKYRLLALYADDRLALLMHLGALMQQAAGELPADVEVVDRFLLWARPRRTPDSGVGSVRDGDRPAG